MYERNRRIVAHYLNLLIVIELLLWNRKERQNAVGHVLYEPFRVSAGVFSLGLVRHSKFPILC